MTCAVSLYLTALCPADVSSAPLNRLTLTRSPPARNTSADLLEIQYLHVHPHSPRGASWDIKPTSAPDLYLKLYLKKNHLWTSPVVRNAQIGTRISQLSPISRFTLRERVDVDASVTILLRVEVWDRDLFRDDFIASFELNAREVAMLREQRRVLSSASVQLSLGWNRALKNSNQGSFAAALRARSSVDTGQLHVISMSPLPTEPALPEIGKERPPSTTSYSTCQAIAETPELIMSFEIDLKDTLVLSRLRSLSIRYQDRLRSKQVTLSHCREGLDLRSEIGLGSGWVRVDKRRLTISIHRTYLARALMRLSDLRVHLIRTVCDRILHDRSPQCDR